MGLIWFLVMLITDVETRPLSGMAVGCVQQAGDPWFEVHLKTFHCGNVKFYLIDGLCGRQSIFSDCSSPFKSVHFFYLQCFFTCFLTMFFRTHSSLWENAVCIKILCFFRSLQIPRSLMRGSDGPAGPLCSSNLSR
jgi:hypothetical protein